MHVLCQWRRLVCWRRTKNTKFLLDGPAPPITLGTGRPNLIRWKCFFDSECSNTIQLIFILWISISVSACRTFQTAPLLSRPNKFDQKKMWQEIWSGVASLDCHEWNYNPIKLIITTECYPSGFNKCLQLLSLTLHKWHLFFSSCRMTSRWL